MYRAGNASWNVDITRAQWSYSEDTILCPQRGLLLSLSDKSNQILSSVSLSNVVGIKVLRQNEKGVAYGIICDDGIQAELHEVIVDDIND